MKNVLLIFMFGVGLIPVGCSSQYLNKATAHKSNENPHSALNLDGGIAKETDAPATTNSNRPTAEEAEACLNKLKQNPVWICVDNIKVDPKVPPDQKEMEDCGCVYGGVAGGTEVGDRPVYGCPGEEIFYVSPNGSTIGVIAPNIDGCAFDYRRTTDEIKNPEAADNCFSSNCHSRADPFIPAEDLPYPSDLDSLIPEPSTTPSSSTPLPSNTTPVPTTTLPPSTPPMSSTDTTTVPVAPSPGLGGTEMPALTDGVDLSLVDLDSDGLSAQDEATFGTDDTKVDTDHDGLTDYQEYFIHMTNGTNQDTDGDGLNDYREVNELLTQPTKSDTDGDGLSDGDEVNSGRTDPLNPDSDSDFLNDSQEVEHGTDPKLADTDGDGLLDGEEVLLHNTDPLVGDTDGDGLSDFEEVAFTNPLDPDSDGDGLSDYDEINTSNTCPTNADTDGDGLGDQYDPEPLQPSSNSINSTGKSGCIGASSGGGGGLDAPNAMGD